MSIKFGPSPIYKGNVCEMVELVKSGPHALKKKKQKRKFSKWGILYNFPSMIYASMPKFSRQCTPKLSPNDFSQ